MIRMSITPIEVIQSQEATQFKHMESQKTLHEQVEISKSFQEQIRKESSKTTLAEKCDHKEYRFDAKEKGQNGYEHSENKKRKEHKKENTKENNKATRSGGFDILI
jgi:hypothetical protein